MKTAFFALCVTLSAGCGGDDGAEPLPDGDAVVVALGSDFASSSVLSRVVLPQLYVDVGGIDGVASLDPVVRQRGDYIVIVNRTGFDNVTVLATADFSLVAQVSTGPGSNPQDAALIGTRLYVADAGGTGLTVIDLDNLGAGALSIDLSSLDPDDGVPNCHAVEVVDGRIWVSCAVRDDADDFLAPRGNGVVAVVDPASDTLFSSFELEHSSPTGFFVVNPNGTEAYIATVPDFFAPASDGCIELLRATPSPENDGCVLENQDLGGYVADMSWYDSGIFAAVVTGFDEVDFGALGVAVEISFATAVTTAEPFTGGGVRAFDVAVCPTGERVVSDATAGIRIYDASGAELSDGAIDVGAPVVQSGTVCL